MPNKYFSVLVQLLPKTDPRYQKWLISLKRRKLPSYKGKTKNIDPRAKKISETFKNRGLDNFYNWRQEMMTKGIIKSTYPNFKKSVDLAILTGIILGDGNIYVFPRTEKLTITLGTDKPDLIKFTNILVQKIFKKQPGIFKHSTANACRITLYEKQISKRLQIPSGCRRYSTTGVPNWIWKSNEYLIGCLRGLFEAEGSLSTHLPTYTYNFAFANRNEKLLMDVKNMLLTLGFHPEVRTNAIRLRKRKEVEYACKLLNFRNYDAG